MKSFAIAAAFGASALAAPAHWQQDGSDWKDGQWQNYKPCEPSTTTTTYKTYTTHVTPTPTAAAYSSSTPAHGSSTPAACPTAAASPSPVATGPTDVQILNYALTLEHLEDKFYREGLANYTEEQFAAAGFDSKFYNNLKIISGDETTHVSFLTSAIMAANGTAVAECTYNFPSTDVKSFVGLASVLEGVGVSAYLGAAASIMEKAYLTAAGSILTTEARHSSFIRNALNEVPFAQPFDNPLDFNEVYTLAAPFIASCPPTNPALPVKAFPFLSLATTGTIKNNQTIALKSAKNLGTGKLYAAFITVTGPIFGDVKSTDGTTFTTQVPAGIAGQSYVVLSKNMTSATDDYIVAGPAIVEVS